MRRAGTWIWVTCLLGGGLWSSITAACASGQESELPSEIQVYEQAVAEWTASIEFCCTFTLRSGRAVSLETARRGEFDESHQEVTSSNYRATGRMSKQGANVRLAVDYDAGLQTVTPAVGGAAPAVTNLGFDEMTDDRLQVRYNRKQQNWGDTVYFVPRKPRLASTYQAGDFSNGIPTPISPEGAYRQRFIVVSRRPETDIEVESIDADYVRITSHTVRDRREWERTVTLWMQPSLPVITRIDYRFTRPRGDGTSTTRTECVMEEFVSCPGGMVPKRVRYIHEGGNGAIVLKEWVSADLGQRRCTDEDFTIHVGESTEFAGLSRPIAAIETRAVRLSDLALTDLGESIFGQKPVPAGRRVDLGRSTGGGRVMLILANLVVIAGLALYFVYRSHKRGRTSGKFE